MQPIQIWHGILDEAAKSSSKYMLLARASGLHLTIALSDYEFALAKGPTPKEREEAEKKQKSKSNGVKAASVQFFCPIECRFWQRVENYKIHLERQGLSREKIGMLFDVGHIWHEILPTTNNSSAAKRSSSMRASSKVEKLNLEISYHHLPSIATECQQDSHAAAEQRPNILSLRPYPFHVPFRDAIHQDGETRSDPFYELTETSSHTRPDNKHLSGPGMSIGDVGTSFSDFHDTFQPLHDDKDNDKYDDNDDDEKIPFFRLTAGSNI